MSFFHYPGKKPSNKKNRAVAELRTPYSPGGTRAYIQAFTASYARAQSARLMRAPIRIRVDEPFTGFVSPAGFTLWRFSGSMVPQLDGTFEPVPDGTLITITSDINNQAFQHAAMAIGLGLPVVVGVFTASIIIPSWIAACVATAIALGIYWYARSIGRWLSDEFEWNVRELAWIVDPRRDETSLPR